MRILKLIPVVMVILVCQQSLAETRANSFARDTTNEIFSRAFKYRNCQPMGNDRDNRNNRVVQIKPECAEIATEAFSHMLTYWNDGFYSTACAVPYKANGFCNADLSAGQFYYDQFVAYIYSIRPGSVSEVQMRNYIYKLVSGQQVSIYR